MKFKNSILVSDFDGTLINKDGHISQENINKINYFIENGGLFCGATGRTHLGVDKMRDVLPVVAPWILFNGAGVYDFRSSSFIHTDTIENNTLKPLAMKIMNEFPHINVQVCTSRMQYFVNPNGKDDLIVIGENQLYENSDIESVKEDWIKLIFSGEAKELLKIEKIIVNNLDVLKYRYFYSGKIYMEIMGRNVSKGSGLKALIENIPNKIEKVYAIGDYYNDVEMLEFADISGAPDNAPEDIKAKVDVIVNSHDNHAVKDFIDYIEKLL